MNSRGLTAALLLALSLPATAVAAPPWSPPQRVDGSTLSPPQLEFGPDGRGFLWWVRGYSTRVAQLGPDGTPATARLVSRGFAAGLIAADARGRTVAIGDVRRGRVSSDLAYATGRVGGHLGRPRRLEPRRAVFRATDASADGDVAVIGQISIRTRVRSARRAVYLWVRRAGGRFGRAQRLAGFGMPTPVAVSINQRGQVLAAWIRNGRVYARQRLADGRVGRVRRVALDRRAQFLRVALADDGAAVVAWTSHRPGGESPPPGDGDVRAVSRPARGDFGPVHQLDHLDEATVATIDAAAGGGRLFVTWNGLDAGRTTVRVAESQGGSFGPPATLATFGTGGGLTDLDVSPAGGGLVTWAEPRGGEPGFEEQALMAAVRVPGASGFGPAEEIAGPLRLFGASAAIDPASGRAAAAWAQLQGSHPFIAVSSRRLP